LEAKTVYADAILYQSLVFKSHIWKLKQPEKPVFHDVLKNLNPIFGS